VIYIGGDQHRPARKQVQQEVVDILRWHRCTYEVERDLHRRSQGTEGEQFDSSDELGRLCSRVGTMGSPRTKAAVEASGITPWICQLLKDLGVKVVVVNPNRVRLIAESRKKADRVDTETLVELLRLGGLPEVHQPSLEARRLRTELKRASPAGAPANRVDQLVR
jgi:transposase